MSNRRRPSGPPTVGLHETFDRVHDGAVVVDPDKCALALFVTMEGRVHLKSAGYSKRQVAGMLRELAAKLEAQS